MTTNHLYDTWFQRIRELRLSQRITQPRNFAWLVYGIYLSRSVYLSRIAGKIPGQAKLQSIIKHLDRFLDNPALRVREWYKPIAVEWLERHYARLGEIHLIVDGTKVGFGHQLLMISLAYRKRAIPIAWTWVKHVRGHSTGDKQIALLAYVKTLIPPRAIVFLVGDTEFGPIVGSLVLVLRFAPKSRYVGLVRDRNGLETLSKSHFESRTACLAWKEDLFTNTSLPGQFAGLLATRRKRTLAARNEPA